MSTSFITGDRSPPLPQACTVLPSLAGSGGQLLVTSDVHLGCAYAKHDLFRELVERLQPGIALALAGDVIDNPRHPLSVADQACLEALARRAALAPVFWIIGNHDDAYRPAFTSNIQFCRELVWNDRLSVVHGDRFDNLMPKNRWFIRFFRAFHALRLRLGASPVHVAVFAKRFGVLYRFLCRHVSRNALEHAQERGLKAIACGHVHQATDLEVGGIRYLNLGAWTEHAPHCLLVDGDAMRLVTAGEALAQPTFCHARQGAQ